MRINDKIKEIEKYLDELEDIPPENYEEYLKSLEKKAACERYFEKIIEAVIDLAFLMIRDKEFKIPEEDTAAFDILADEKIIEPELAHKLKNAKGMRNLIAHEYGSVDDKIVFNALTEELKDDVEEFIDAIEKSKN